MQMHEETLRNKLRRLISRAKMEGSKVVAVASLEPLVGETGPLRPTRMQRGQCPQPACRKDVALLGDGTTRSHLTPRGLRCQGGKSTPKAAS